MINTLIWGMSIRIVSVNRISNLVDWDTIQTSQSSNNRNSSLQRRCLSMS